ncbi:MAG: hypothetical protein ACFB22_13675 [Rhodothalassiaceae bacterium]
MLFAAPADAIALTVLALAVDLIFGGRQLLGRLPAPEIAWQALATLYPAAVYAGALAVGLSIDLYLVPHGWSWPVLVLLTAWLIGQRRVWASLKQMHQQLSHAPTTDPHAAVRLGLAQAVSRFHDTALTGSLALILGGMTGMMLVSAAGALQPARGERALSDGRGAAALVGLATAPLAVLILRLAGLAYQHRAGGRSAMRARAGRLPGRHYSAAALARALGVQFRGVDGWLGPPEGRARADLGDLNRGVRLLMRASLIWLGLLCLGLMAALPAASATINATLLKA